MDAFALVMSFYFQQNGCCIDDAAVTSDKTWSSSKIKDTIDNIIDDNTTSTDKTWSSSKINDETTYLDAGTF